MQPELPQIFPCVIHRYSLPRATEKATVRRLPPSAQIELRNKAVISLCNCQVSLQMNPVVELIQSTVAWMRDVLPTQMQTADFSTSWITSVWLESSKLSKKIIMLTYEFSMVLHCRIWDHSSETCQVRPTEIWWPRRKYKL